jgi:lipopolysaccharide transport system ATP-binding protein
MMKPMEGYAVVARDISKVYRLYGKPVNRIKEAFTGRRFHQEFHALSHVSFSLKKGSTMGILGVNGSGKSTLLKIVCGYLPPTKGVVETQGLIASILELGTGFNRDFTGRQNALLYGGLMGFSKEVLESWMLRVEEFAATGPFFERPLRLYSSGMYARLAFACAINTDPDILIIDEALAVGDMAFQHKCMNRLKEIQKNGVSILFVSHSMGAIKSLCREALLLDKGCVIKSGSAEDVANFYHALLSEKEAGETTARKTRPAGIKSAVRDSKSTSGASSRIGSEEVRIKEVFILDREGNRVEAVDFNQEVAVRVRLFARQACRPEVAGILIRDRYGIELLGTNTALEGMEMPTLEEGETCYVDFQMNMPLQKGSYSVTAAVGHDPDRPVFYDWWDNACVFEVMPPEDRKLAGCKLHLPIKVSIEKENR